MITLYSWPTPNGVRLYGAGWTDLLSLESLAANQAQLGAAVSARPALAVTTFIAVYAAVTAADRGPAGSPAHSSGVDPRQQRPGLI